MPALLEGGIMGDGSKRLQLGVAIVGLVVWLCVPPEVRAESGEIAALRQEVAGLKQAVERLDARVEQIEERLPAPSESGSSAGAAASQVVAPTPAPSPSPSTSASASAESLRDQWSRVSHGMTQQEIEALLGRPQRTMAANAKTIWYYTYRDIGSGSVVFARDGAVDDWRSPPFHRWWWW